MTSSFNTLAEPLVIILACLFVWITVSYMNSLRKLIGICIITFLLCLTLLKWLPFSYAIAQFITFPLAVLMLLEFTRVAKTNRKISLLWLLFVPLFFGSMAEQYFSGEDWWVPFLFFPIAWLYMSFYANATTFKSTMKYVGFSLLLLLISIYIAVDILSLSLITQVLDNEFITEIFNHIDTVPFLHLGITVVFLPLLITCLLCYVIAYNREKNSSSISS